MIARWVGGILALAIVCMLPNLTWLGTSTLRIHNGSSMRVANVSYVACEARQVVGALAPNESVFRFLDACGDDTLTIRIADSEFCQTYVEGELYHVDAILTADATVRCSYDDLLSSLFITKALF